MHLSCPTTLVAAGLLGFVATATAVKPKNAILLSDVQSLTLRAGKMTAHRRVPTVPQLSCRASPQAICDLHTIDAMRCTNQGSGYDAEDIQWSCTASLPPELRLGNTEVICEGYSSADDPYVLRGSCAVEFRLLLTDYGEEKFPDLAGGTYGSSSLSSASTRLFWLVLIGIIAWMLFSAFRARDHPNPARPNDPRRPGFWGGGGGGGGGGGDFWDPPPPYPGSKPPGSEGWQPGFWTGVAGGAAAGYAAGRSASNNNSNNNNNNRNDRSYGSGSAGPSRSSGSSRSVSSARHESTGFGSTRRR